VKKAAVVYFSAISKLYPEKTEDNHDKPQSG
jgi:hypothetical protein